MSPKTVFGFFHVHGLCVNSFLCEQYTHKYSTCRVAQHDHISELEGSGLHIFVSEKQLSSTCHVSFFAAPDTDHKHKFSLTYLTYLSDNLTNAHKTFGTRSIFTLRSSTAERRINTNPISQVMRPSRLRTKPSTPKRSSLKTSSRKN